MTWIEDSIGGWGSSLLIGVGVSLAAPVVLPVVGAVIRPIAKGLIGGVMALTALGRDTVSEVNKERRSVTTATRPQRQAQLSANGAKSNRKGHAAVLQKAEQTARSRRDRSHRRPSATARAA